MLTQILRTIVPALWGSVIGWLLSIVPVLEPLREQLLSVSELAVPVLGAVIIGAWYTVWAKLQPRLPDWLVRALLGSAKSPSYETLAVLAPQVQPGELPDWHPANNPKHLADE